MLKDWGGKTHRSVLNSVLAFEETMTESLLDIKQLRTYFVSAKGRALSKLSMG